MTARQFFQTTPRSAQASQGGRGRAAFPAEPCATRQAAGADSVSGGDTRSGAFGFEPGYFGIDDGDLGHDAKGDALMQPSSSASMQVDQLHLSRDNARHMSTAAQIRDWLNATLADTGLSVKEWARKSGVAASTIHRALKDDYQFVTSNRTLSKLASAAGVAPPDSPSVEPQRVGAEFLPIRYDVGAGLWQEVTDSQVFLGVGTVASDPAYAGFPQWLERVQGDSMDQDYRDGELVHVVDAIALGYAPQHGDHVVLVRRRADGAEMERTIKEVVRLPGGGLEFWPRSSNPRWSAPIHLVHGLQADDQTIEVEIAAIVIGSYRPRRR